MQSPPSKELVAASEVARDLGQPPAGLLRLSVPRAVVPILLEPFVDGNKAIDATVSGPLVAHDYPTLLGAAIQGLGLAQVPGPLAKAAIAEGRLHALLTPFAVTTPGVFLYHPGRRQVLPKLRAFIEHVKHQSADVRRKLSQKRPSSRLATKSMN